MSKFGFGLKRLVAVDHHLDIDIASSIANDLGLGTNKFTVAQKASCTHRFDACLSRDTHEPQYRFHQPKDQIVCCEGAGDVVQCYTNHHVPVHPNDVLCSVFCLVLPKPRATCTLHSRLQQQQLVSMWSEGKPASASLPVLAPGNRPFLNPVLGNSGRQSTVSRTKQGRISGNLPGKGLL
ncbi:hypothetical protein G6F68_012656 [Rhizopus microsporus]|nr:hypothetical protein G6F68_012656 [Rhizopus microsporus]